MQRFFRILFIGSFLFMSFGAIAAPNKAAMIIRFDHNNAVNYERSLQKVIQAATNIKPLTFFDIVSVVPHTGNKNQDQSATQWANSNTSSVVEQIKRYGVNPDNIRVTYQPSKNTERNEVHIFVR